MDFKRLKQLFFNLFSIFFVLFRYRNKVDAFKLFKKTLGNVESVSLEKREGVILITPVRVSPISNLFEALIGKFYQMRGYDVRFLMCNQVVKYCENLNSNTNRYITCSLCQAEQKRFEKYFNISSIEAHDFISNIEIEEINKRINGCNFKNRNDFIFDKVDLYESIVSAVMRYTLKSDIKENEFLIKRFAETAFVYSKITSNILKSFQVERLITSHGIYSTWGSILETAKYNEIESIVWGRGYVGQGKLLFSRNQNLEREFSMEKESEFDVSCLSEREIQMIKDYYLKKADPNSKVDYVNYYKDLKTSDYNLSLVDNIKGFKKSFGMFTNIPWDGEMLKTTPAFPTTRVFVKTVIDWFIRNKDCLLIIRSHPAEVSREEGRGAETFEEVLFELYPSLPENVIFIKPDSNITSYEVSKLVDAIVLFGSTMSLELAIQKNVVIQAGINNVSNKKIVFDCFTKDDLYKHLNLVKSGKLEVTDYMYENALKYANYWLFKRHINDSSVELNKLVFEKYNFKNEKDFLDDEMLNYVFDKINKKRKIIYE